MVLLFALKFALAQGPNSALPAPGVTGRRVWHGVSVTAPKQNETEQN